MTIATTTATQSLTVDGVGPVDVSFTERGAGRPFVILHGGAGPLSVSGFADLLAETEQVRVHRANPSRFRRHAPARRAGQHSRAGRALCRAARPARADRCHRDWKFDR